jgi:hypothetical protein
VYENPLGHSTTTAQTKHTMATTLHRFAELPAELRVRVWALAHEKEQSAFQNRDCGRIIELRHYNQDRPTVCITISKRYPKLFSVNREARYEVGKLEGGEWIAPPIVKHGRRGDVKLFEIYFNFKDDTFFVAERFMDAIGQWKWGKALSVEEHRLICLRNILGSTVLSRVQRIMLSTLQRSTTYDRISWSGEGFEIFKNGQLSMLTIVTDDLHYMLYGSQALKDEWRRLWQIEGDDHGAPILAITSSSFDRTDDAMLEYLSAPETSHPRGGYRDHEQSLPFDCYGIITRQVVRRNLV